jgi:DNA-binding NarL/FixJ family response regulator
VEDERPALCQDLTQVVDTIAPLQHINHVLGKLGAANRTEAVDRARRTALIP